MGTRRGGWELKTETKQETDHSQKFAIFCENRKLKAESRKALAQERFSGSRYIAERAPSAHPSNGNITGIAPLPTELHNTCCAMRVRRPISNNWLPHFETHKFHIRSVSKTARTLARRPTRSARPGRPRAHTEPSSRCTTRARPIFSPHRPLPERRGFTQLECHTRDS